jgi:hypothetical protein
MSEIYLMEAIEDYLFDKAEGILYRHVEGGIFLIEYPDGRKIFHHDGKLHREDGPAVETSTGRKYWYYYGKLHRVNGPAIEFSDSEGGYKAWYYKGKFFDCKNQVEFERFVKVKAFW